MNNTQWASFAGSAQAMALLDRLPPGSVGREVLLAERDLASRAAAVIDLSGDAPAAIAGQRPRRARRYRRLRKGMPELLATPGRLGRTLEAWCPFCRTEHTHSRHGADEDCGPACPCQMHGGRHHGFRGRCTCPPGSGDGHRGAHCGPGSPLQATGYWLSEVIS
jgi:hypothetical protein